METKVSGMLEHTHAPGTLGAGSMLRDKSNLSHILWLLFATHYSY